MLNPGPSYVLKSGDILFYINITKEENSTLMPMMHEEKRQREEPAAPPGGGGPNDERPLNDLSVQDLPAPSTSSAAATLIRIESSSPTPLGLRPEEMLAPPLPHHPSHTHRIPTKKHSVADGVARSLCSVAGIAGAELALPVADEPLELRHLAAGFLGKRLSSASTSAAIGHHHQSANMGQRNASNLELAALAKSLRKGSNISITSTKSRDVSPTRLKQVVSGLAVKMKRVKLGKSLTHLTIPRMDYGGSSASSTESFVNARGRRPSIAPVPAMMGESEEHDSDHEREQESYFAMSWQSSSESSP